MVKKKKEEAKPIDTQSSANQLADKFQALLQQIIDFSNVDLSWLDYLREISKKLVEFSGCDAIELHIKKEEKKTTCKVIKRTKRSFTLEILSSVPNGNKENIQNVKVIPDLDRFYQDAADSEIDPSLPFFTKNGSFRTGDIKNTLQLYPGEKIKTHYYSFHIHKDYNSMAIIPIKVGSQRIGILQLMCRKKDFFPGPEIEYYENFVQTLGLVLLNQRSQAALKERVKEMTCLYGIAHAVERYGTSLDEILESTVNLIPPAWQYPEITQSRVLLDGQTYATPGFKAGPHKQTADIVVKGIKRGAVEVVYTEKKHTLDEGPFIKEERNLINTIARELALIIERKHSELAGQKLQMRRTMKAQLHKIPSAPFGIIGKSGPMRKVFDSVEKAAAASASATVVITGESGTGKELVARGIHYSSSRASAPFVPVNCGGIPENLLESELFGYVKGAFTGAFETRAGFFQTADGGTIFLDEISETSSAMQVKLLRVLQDKEICMVGSRRTQKVDVRILAATNKDILGLVKNGLFREDLYYRLNVINIDLPPLRDRGDDILLLIRYFAARFAKEAKKPAPQFSDHALDVLKNYNWPGNVRELENVIHRLVIMNEEDIIDVPDLPSLMRSPIHRGPGLNRTLAEVEAVHIRNVLASVKGNKTQAAKILGIDRKTLREKLKCYSLDL